MSELTKRERLTALFLADFPFLGADSADWLAERNKSRFKGDPEDWEDYVDLTVTAYARHYFTDYDQILQAAPSEETKRAARRQLRREIEAILDYWRAGHGAPPLRLR